jgi:hypothetical protein
MPGTNATHDNVNIQMLIDDLRNSSMGNLSNSGFGPNGGSVGFG